MQKIKFIILTLICVSLLSCMKFEKVDQRQRPDGAKAKARKNIEEGKGVSIAGMMNRKGKTNYEFSTSNPMWRASLETLDFLPLTTVDYSGGMIITDWYSDNNSQSESIKISVRFLSNEIRSESIKIIVHKKVCSTVQNCKVTSMTNSQIREKLHSTILRKAALLDKDTKNKKKKN